jgi:hypothetical protein
MLAARGPRSCAAMASTIARCSQLHRRHEVPPPRLVAARDAHAFAQVLFQKAQQQPELRVAGGFADHAVEGQVFGHAVLPAATTAVSMALRAAPQRSDLAARGALGRQRGDLALEHAPHLDHVHHGLLPSPSTLGSKASGWLCGASATNTPEPWRDCDQRTRLELVHRLAHHGARHAVHGGQLLFGRQPVARRSLPDSICAHRR